MKKGIKAIFKRVFKSAYRNDIIVRTFINSLSIPFDFFIMSIIFTLSIDMIILSYLDTSKYGVIGDFLLISLISIIPFGLFYIIILDWKGYNTICEYFKEVINEIENEKTI